MKDRSQQKMKPLKKNFFLMFAVISVMQNISAEELALTLEDKVASNQISFGLSTTSLTSNLGNIQGSGPKIDLTHFFQSKFSADLYLSTALSSDNGIKISFTNIGATAYYTLWGECYENKSNIYLKETLLVSESTIPNNCLRLGGGLKQFFLNGSKNIYSGFGLGVTAAYHFLVWDYYFKATAGYSFVSASKTQLNDASVGISFILSL